MRSSTVAFQNHPSPVIKHLFPHERKICKLPGYIIINVILDFLPCSSCLKYALSPFIWVITCWCMRFCASARDLEVPCCIQRKIVPSSSFPNSLKRVGEGSLIITTLPSFVRTISPLSFLSHTDAYSFKLSYDSLSSK